MPSFRLSRWAPAALRKALGNGETESLESLCAARYVCHLNPARDLDLVVVLEGLTIANPAKRLIRVSIFVHAKDVADIITSNNECRVGSSGACDSKD